MTDSALASPVGSRIATPTAAEPPVRVLMACDHIDFNGALHGGGRALIELMRALDPDKVALTVCVLRSPSDLGRALIAEGLPLIFFGDSRFNPISLLRLVRLIRQRRIEVLHLTDFGACTFGRIAGMLTGVPALVQIISHHSEHTHRRFPRYVEFAYRALAPRTAKALPISESVRRFAIDKMGFTAGQTEVLYYPLPQYSLAGGSPEESAAVRARHGIASDDPLIGAVTRLFPVKGIRYLIDAFAEVLVSRPHAWLLLVGSGPEEDALRARCRERGVQDRVIFAGFQRSVEAYVRAFDVSVVPSLEEGFGLVAVESMALGTPVVASKIDGLMEIIDDERSGLLVEPADPRAIANAVLRVLNDRQLHQRLSAEGRNAAQRFSVDRYAGRLAELYAEAAGRSPRLLTR